jgi:D-xylose transport system ATP-binding protein
MSMQLIMCRSVYGPVKALSGGQRQSVTIARAVYFDATILKMDKPPAALGSQETTMVTELIVGLKSRASGSS